MMSEDFLGNCSGFGKETILFDELKLSSDNFPMESSPNSKMKSQFFQSEPQLKNTFQNDELLRSYLKDRLPGNDSKIIYQHLEHCGEEAISTWLRYAKDAELHPPVHVPYSPWGKRIDEIRTSEGWKNLEAAAAQEGIVAHAYLRQWGSYSRVYQMSLLYLFHSSSEFFSCPLAMTDGAARCIEQYAPTSNGKSVLLKAFGHLTSTDPKNFWTSGQWMTERIGGSDVSNSETMAYGYQNPFLEKMKTSVPDFHPGVFKTQFPNSQDPKFDHALFGTKWFTSATTSQMALLLARDVDVQGNSVSGSRGLSLYYTEMRDSENKLKNIFVHRLKEKLGTKALPTAELTLEGTPAVLIGGATGGVKKIASLLNITRIYNSICAVSHMRRALDLAEDYSNKRVAFGQKISDHPLHRKTLTELERTFQKCFSFVFFVVELLGKEEVGTATDDEKVLLRSLTPVLKLYTAKKCVELCSEVLEVFGGSGYVEDTGIPKLLRDAQVFSIWEGTTNVLSLDFLRALEKENAWSALAPVLQRGGKSLAEIKAPTPASLHYFQSKKLDIQLCFDQELSKCRHSLDQVGAQIKLFQDPGHAQLMAREFCFHLAEVIGFLTSEGFLKVHHAN